MNVFNFIYYFICIILLFVFNILLFYYDLFIIIYLLLFIYVCFFLCLGHTQSWGPGAEGLLTPCFDAKGSPENFFGPINPVPIKNYQFLARFFREINDVFPDSYVHLGGDEVDFACW